MKKARNPAIVIGLVEYCGVTLERSLFIDYHIPLCGLPGAWVTIFDDVPRGACCGTVFDDVVHRDNA